MTTYEFDVILANITQIEENQSEALFTAGCDDATPASCDGVAWLHFDREAPSLEHAIRTAVEQVQSTGLSVAKVELDANFAISVGA